MGLWIPDREPMTEMFASILLILIMGYAVYKLLTSPIKALLFIWKAAVMVVLGLLVWFAIFWLLMP